MQIFTKPRLVLSIFALVMAYVGSSLSFGWIVPGGFQGYDEDGWLREEGNWQSSELSTRHNTLRLVFDPRRPDSPTEVGLGVRMCGVELPRHAVSEANPVVQLRLDGGCSPMSVELRVENPWIPGGLDKRALGVRLSEVRISSALGFALIDPRLCVSWGFLFVLLGLLVAELSTGGRGSGAGIVATSLAAVLLARADVSQWASLQVLFISTLCILGGVALSRLPRRYDLKQNSPYLKGMHWLILLCLTCVLGIAAFLRFNYIDFGLPALLHPDESIKAKVLVSMQRRHSLNPQYFSHPTLLLYFSFFVEKAFDLFGIAAELPGKAHYVLAGRFVSAAAGTLSVLLLYFLGATLFCVRSALLAAAFLAVCPLHVTCSRYQKEDALLVFFVLLTALFVALAVKRGAAKLLIPAALAAGLATSTKYTGMLSMAFVLLSPWLVSGRLKPDRQFLMLTALALPVAALAALLGSPYALLDHNTFLEHFGRERSHMQHGHDVKIDAWSQYWMYHVQRSLVSGATVLPSILALFGVGLMLARRNWAAFMVLLGVTLFYLPAEWVKAKPYPQADRYIMPVLPFLALAAGELLSSLRAVAIRPVAAILCILFLTIPLTRSARLASEVSPDTRALMTDWLNQNLPTKSKILLDGFYSPRLLNTTFETEVIRGDKNLRRLSIAHLRNSGFDYLLINSFTYGRHFAQPISLGAFREAYQGICNELPLVKEIAPRYGSYGFHNPTLRLYSLKQ